MADSFYPDYIGFVGTTSTGGSRGIYRIGLDASLGRVQVLGTRPMYNAGYLALSGDKKSLYVLSEGMTFKGRGSGGITAFDVREGRFEEQNWAVTGGQRPCFVCCDDKSGEIYVSNFYNGTMAVWERKKDGRLGKRLGYISHEKTAPAPVGPLLHCVVKSPAGRYAASLELVGGVIFIYDCENQYQIVWKERMPKGADPRHLCFSRDGRFLYVNHQGDEKVSVYHFNPEAEKKLFHLQTLSVKGEDGIEKTEPAAIRLSPDGRLLAVSSRGMGTEHREDLITLFDVNQQEGTLSLKQAVRTGGQMPRDFNFTPDGKFLVTGYQFQSYLDLYQVTENGLVFISSSDVLPSPVCIAF